VTAHVRAKGGDESHRDAAAHPGDLGTLPRTLGAGVLDRAATERRRDRQLAEFAADVDPEKAAFMADAQVPWGVEALAGAITEPAWKKKPTWYLVATEDKMIPPAAQRFMSERAGAEVVEQRGSQAVYVSHPEAVAALVEKAAQSVSAA
jgi:hypothetical protein